MRALLILVLVLPLAGCTQLDDAQAKLDDARAELDEARAEAQAAKDRYDRVRSATVIREERLVVVVSPKSNETEFWFDHAAWRAEFGGNGTLIATENLTSLPPIRLRTSAYDVTCDPMTCRGAITGLDVNVTWADGAQGGFTLVGGNAACDPAADEPLGNLSSYCAFPMLRRESTIRVTTALSDAST